jgi:hypothetical protein
MNDFEPRLESELRLLLDPIVKAAAPPRNGRRRLLEGSQLLELSLVTPVAVPVPVEGFA